MRVAVIGARGQVGSDIVAAARSAGFDVLPLAHEDCDVTNGASVESALRAVESGDVVVNTAAFHRVDDAETDPECAFALNAVGAHRVAVTSRRKGASVVFFSSDYVFDGRKQAPYVESDAPRPINVYGASKAAGERLVAIANSAHYVIRISSVFGVAGSAGKGGNFVESMISKAARGERIEVVDDITVTPTFAAHAAQLLVGLLSARAAYGIYHLSNSGPCTWNEFANTIFEMLGVRARAQAISTAQRPTSAVRPAQSALASEKLETLGLAARPWRQGLEEYLRLKGHLRATAT